MRWCELELRQPRLAAVARVRLIDPGVLLVATIRRDGTPRLSPVEPYLMEGDLWLSMLWGSHKAADLLRDPRVLLHGLVTGRDGGDGELKVRGQARDEQHPDVQRRYAAAVHEHLGWRAGAGAVPPVRHRRRARVLPALRRRHRRPVRHHLAAGRGVRPARHVGDERRRAGAGARPAGRLAVTPG